MGKDLFFILASCSTRNQSRFQSRLIWALPFLSPLWSTSIMDFDLPLCRGLLGLGFSRPCWVSSESKWRIYIISEHDQTFDFLLFVVLTWRKTATRVWGWRGHDHNSFLKYEILSITQHSIICSIPSQVLTCWPCFTFWSKHLRCLYLVKLKLQVPVTTWLCSILEIKNNNPHFGHWAVLLTSQLCFKVFIK